MAKDNKLGNLLNIEEFDKLHGKQKPTKKTEIGGFAVLEHHIADMDGQIDFIKKNLENCNKKKIKKIYKLVEKCLYKKDKKETEKTNTEEKSE
jgi:hypothetical protein